jgi:hypothetical protein
VIFKSYLWSLGSDGLLSTTMMIVKEFMELTPVVSVGDHPVLIPSPYMCLVALFRQDYAGAVIMASSVPPSLSSALR